MSSKCPASNAPVPQKTFHKLANDSAVRVGRMWGTGKALPDTLKRYSRLVFCLNQSEQHPYSLRGTATGLRWQRRCMLFWCSHQFLPFANGREATGITHATVKLHV